MGEESKHRNVTRWFTYVCLTVASRVACCTCADVANVTGHLTRSSMLTLIVYTEFLYFVTPKGGRQGKARLTDMSCVIV